MSAHASRWDRIDELYRAAADLPSEQWRPFVVARCSDDSSLIDAVLSLLAEPESEHRDTLLARMRQALDNTPTELPTRIGLYHILETIGEGGMGTVYRAEQREPVRRQVALKLIKLGMDSRSVVARFEHERQALALMQHDGIAKVHDCGTTERGQPYFVMEFVPGQPLASYCDENKLSLPERLRLVQQVCAAVSHAHQKGIVHRDLKPGNVLVSEQDGRPQVKVIDFGLAKAIGEPRAGMTQATVAGTIIGTPEYMAPEQADPGNLDVDTRADVYSLGVMLFELLVGQLPFTREQVLRAAQGPAPRESLQPPRPSARLPSDGMAKAQAETARGTKTSVLRRALRSDLDWVVMKAMEPERAQRYETANALADDLQRFLDHEPLAAGPPSAAYRLRKFVRRYRLQSAVAVLVGVALAVAGIGIYLGWRDAQISYARAEMSTARLAQARGDFGQALASLEAAAATGRIDPVEIQIGRVIAHLGAFDDARAGDELARLSASPIPSAHAARGLLLRGLITNRALDPDAGLDDVRAAVSAGGLTVVEALLAEYLLATDFDTAKAAIDRAVQHDPHDRLANMARVSLLFCACLVDEARAYRPVLKGIYPADALPAVLDLLCGAFDGDEAVARAAYESLLGTPDEGLDAAVRLFLGTTAPLRSVDDYMVRMVFDMEPFGLRERITSALQTVPAVLGVLRLFQATPGDAGNRALRTVGSILPPCFLRGIRQVPRLLQLALNPTTSPLSQEQDADAREVFRDAADGTGLAVFRFMVGYTHAMRGEHDEAVRHYERARSAGALIPVPRCIDRGLLASCTVLWRRTSDVAARAGLRRDALAALNRLWPSESRSTALANLLARAVELDEAGTVLGVVECWRKVAAGNQEALVALRAAVGHEIEQCPHPDLAALLRIKLASVR